MAKEKTSKKLNPPPELEQIEDTVAEATAAEATADKTDALFREISERASFLADRMENRTNTFGNLHRVLERLIQPPAMSRDAPVKCFPRNELHGDEVDAVG